MKILLNCRVVKDMEDTAGGFSGSRLHQAVSAYILHYQANATRQEVCAEQTGKMKTFLQTLPLRQHDTVGPVQKQMLKSTVL